MRGAMCHRIMTSFGSYSSDSAHVPSARGPEDGTRRPRHWDPAVKALLCRLMCFLAGTARSLPRSVGLPRCTCPACSIQWTSRLGAFRQRPLECSRGGACCQDLATTWNTRMVFLLTHRLVEGFVFLLLLRVHILSAMLPLGAHFCQPLEARMLRISATAYLQRLTTFFEHCCTVPLSPRPPSSSGDAGTRSGNLRPGMRLRL